jgi:glycerophosphoryl diester phosphodiesterase
MVKPVYLLALSLAFAGTLPAADSTSSGIWVVAHRGAKNIAPENTIAAFEAAAKFGANYVEVDVRPSKDGELILMHDATVNRTTNGKGAVRDLTFAEIRALDAGNGEKVPTFRETLLWGKRRNVRIDVDHKEGSAEDVARVIRETGMIGNVVIEGNRQNLKRFSELLPGVDTMPKVSSAADITEVCRLLKTSVVRLSTEQLVDPGSVRAVRSCPARVSYTILGKTDNEEEMRRIVALGAEVIETDRPEILSEIRRQMNAEPHWPRVR